MTLASAVGAYLAVSLGEHAGLNSWLDKRLIDGKTQAEVDGTDAWVMAAAAVLLVLGVARLARRSR